ncbi:uncharacterized protein LOC144159410 [Haemaphysalis longicornis]
MGRPHRLLGSRHEFKLLSRWYVALLLALICVPAVLSTDDIEDFRKPLHHTAAATCPERVPVWQCLRLSWSAPPCRNNFDCAMPYPCCLTWCRNFCANDYRS